MTPQDRKMIARMFRWIQQAIGLLLEASQDGIYIDIDAKTKQDWDEMLMDIKRWEGENETR